MNTINTDTITTDILSMPLLTEKNISAAVLRLDKIHKEISGNKWFKLRYYIDDAIRQHKKTVVTFGGAWSNHILATAAMCKLKKIHAIGIIRGEESLYSAATLQKARQLGMELYFTDRHQYRKKIIPPEADHPGYYYIPEGGYGTTGAAGAATILDHCQMENYSHICCAAGTGTMAAGIWSRISDIQTVIAISVLKNNIELDKKIRELTPGAGGSLNIIHSYHGGGYAKHQPWLLRFMNELYAQTGIPTDFVYTGKLFYAIMDMVKNDQFAAGSRLLLIHSGGLQGNDSLDKGTLIFE